ncbi:RnfABCDGE type electron transport complex subunit G [Prolixibacteraceae bacterium JC049]|nr:RnfABCDGE type electron transport complex subunit G [Prolixibacteraceae bacterium JC049]
MAKKESSLKNMLIALFSVTFIASASLGLVENATRGAIAEAARIKQEKAIKAVLPEFDKLGDAFMVKPKSGPDSLEVFPAYKGSEVVGMAIKTYTNSGFSGHISVMAGFKPDGTISGYSVLEHKETPGLGTKMVTWFRDATKAKQNVIGKNPGNINLTVSKDGGDVDAITAATISSRAFLDALQRAYDSVKDIDASTMKGGSK